MENSSPIGTYVAYGMMAVLFLCVGYGVLRSATLWGSLAALLFVKREEPEDEDTSSGTNV